VGSTGVFFALAAEGREVDAASSIAPIMRLHIA